MAFVANQLMAAMQKLRENGLWREARAEYAHSRRGGYEGFFRGGLLWAFNSANPKTYLVPVRKCTVWRVFSGTRDMNGGRRWPVRRKARRFREAATTWRSITRLPDDSGAVMD